MCKENNSNYFIELLRGLYKLTHERHLEKDVAYIKDSVNFSNYHGHYPI